jgi:hypothetical protein
LFSDVRPIVTQLPDGWVRKTEKIEIDKVGHVRCGLVFTLPTPMPWPSKFKGNEYGFCNNSWSDDITLKEHAVWEEFATEFNAYNERAKAAEARRTEFVEMVTKVIGAYATLAPALKAWPPLWDLIPDDVKDKHREIVEREKKTVELNVDLNKLTALSTAAKLGV